MNILDRSKNMKRVSVNKGGEYQGPCPVCTPAARTSISNRMHIWPLQDEGRGSWWCRGCDKGGDAVQWLRDIEGMGYRQACEAVGKKYNPSDDHSEPSAAEKTKPAFAPAAPKQIESAWQEKAERLVTWSHENLLADPAMLAWLADQRGITLDTIKKLQLGINIGEKGKDIYRSRESWGLETQLKKNTKAKKLWLPRGLTIPHYLEGALCRIRIRRTEGEPRYYVVPGSNGHPMLLDGTPKRPWKTVIVVESELDAIMLFSQAGHLAAYLAMGSSHTKPDTVVLAAIIDGQRGKGHKVQIKVALDNDEPGKKASGWWLETFGATLHPVPGARKDPGEAFQAGINLVEWIEAALPTAYHVGQPKSEPVSDPVAEQPKSHSFVVTLRTAKDGRAVHITESKTEYARLVAAGEIVFDYAEIDLAIKTRATLEEAVNFLAIKQAFSGTRLTEVILETASPTSERPQYLGKYTAR